MPSIQDDVCFVLSFVAFSILVGVVGFRIFAHQGWYESLCCASLSLGGNYTMKFGEDGVLFYSFYTLYGSIIFFVIAGIIINRLYLNFDERMYQQVTRANEDSQRDNQRNPNASKN